MKVFFQIAYFLVGIAQLFAVWDGTELFFGAESFIGKLFAFFAAITLTYIPLIGSAIGVYGAVNVWDWGLIKSLVLFFWYIPVYVLFFAASLVSNRR